MDRVGVFSFARHHPEFYNGVHAKNSKLGGGEMVSWWLDCVRTCLHELGHLLGMRHCIYFRCLMNGNNGPGDSAGRTTFLCPVCLRKTDPDVAQMLAAQTLEPQQEHLLQLCPSQRAKSCCDPTTADHDEPNVSD
uniref:Uncharacterized protein n=1 Tax=Oxyrrhis marina TaxID=2969 RepID=A0A7S3XHA7_OXYMA